MSAIDWEKHRALFSAQKEQNPSLTIKDYAEQNELSFNTARKQLNSKKLPGDLSIKPSKKIPQNSAKNTPKKRPIKNQNLQKLTQIQQKTASAHRRKNAMPLSS